jgi:hypothetical protein
MRVTDYIDEMIKKDEEIDRIRGCILIKDKQISHLHGNIFYLECENKELKNMLTSLHQKVSELTRI